MLLRQLSFASVISLNLIAAAHAQGFSGGSVDVGDLGNAAKDALNGSSTKTIKDQISNLPVSALGTLEQIKKTATTVIGNVTEGSNFCERLGSEVRIDCLAESYEVTARKLSNKGTDAEMKKAFTDAAAKLRRIVEQNVDTKANRVLPTVKTRKVNRKASRPLRSVKTANLKRSNAQANRVISELATVILRSNARSQRYARMARSVEANLILLRS